MFRHLKVIFRLNIKQYIQYVIKLTRSRVQKVFFKLLKILLKRVNVLQVLSQLVLYFNNIL